MDEQMLRDVLAQMLQPVEKQLVSVSKRLDGVEVSIEKRLNSIEDSVGERLGSMEVSVGERLDRIETSLNNVQSQVNTVEHRLIDIGESFRLVIRQTSAEKGEMKHDRARVKLKIGL